MTKSKLFHLSILGSMALLQNSTVIAGVVPAGTKENPCTMDNYFEEASPGVPLYCKDGVSGAVTSIENLRIAIPSTRKQNPDKEEETASAYFNKGLSAGNSVSNAGFWGNVSYSEFESTFIAAAYEAESSNILLGYDIMVGPRSVLGVAAGYENLSTTTFYNGGGNDQDGFTIAPYYGVALTDRLTFDMSIGIASLDNTQSRIDPTDGLIYQAGYDAIRYFGAFNLSHSYKIDNALISARIGYTHAQEIQDGYTEFTGANARTVDERTIELSQAELGFDAIYYGNDIKPYAAVTFRKDLDLDEDAAAGGLPSGHIVRSNDETETELVIGIDLNPAEDLTVSLEGNRVFSRDQYDKWGISLGFRMSL